MAEEIERIAQNTKFNDIAMLDGSGGDVKIHVGTASTIDIDKVDMTKTGLGIDTGIGSAQYVATAAGVADNTAAWVTAAGTFDITFAGENQIVTAALSIGRFYG